DLYATDGTAPNTVKVATLAQPPSMAMADLGGVTLFAGYDVAQGYALFKSDGTLACTALVKAFPLGFRGLTTVGASTFFSADDAASGREVWKTDGTTAGTILVTDIVADRKSS